jgi:hypothetical protein
VHHCVGGQQLGADDSSCCGCPVRVVIILLQHVAMTMQRCLQEAAIKQRFKQ